MEVALKRWGNSHGVRIPKEFISMLDLTVGTPLDMEVKNDSIVISKKHTHKSLEERVKESGKPLCFESEIDFGAPKGREVW